VAKRVFLHVASTKTGTTFLQRVMWSHRRLLLDQGILLPGAGISDHFRAAIDVREQPHLIRDPSAAVHAWDRLVEEIAGWDGDAVVSHELFAPASADQAAAAIAKLGEAEVHVVLTSRDLARQIPAEWQEHLKHRSVLAFPEFVQTVRSDSERGPFSPNGYYFWDEQDVPRVVERWGSGLPRDRVHVVTVPPPGARGEELWARFSGLVGIDDRGFDPAGARSNSSLRAEQAELLRRLNTRLGGRLPLPGPYPEMVKEVLAHRILADRDGTRFGVVGDDLAYARKRSMEMVARLRDLHIDVVGDLAELVPELRERGVSGDAVVPPERVLDEAVEALAEVLDRLSAERTRRQRLRVELDEARAQVRHLEARPTKREAPRTLLAAARKVRGRLRRAGR
jgi:hypothetical protein